MSLIVCPSPPCPTPCTLIESSARLLECPGIVVSAFIHRSESVLQISPPRMKWQFRGSSSLLTLNFSTSFLRITLSSGHWSGLTYVLQNSDVCVRFFALLRIRETDAERLKQILTGLLILQAFSGFLSTSYFLLQSINHRTSTAMIAVDC